MMSRDGELLFFALVAFAVGLLLIAPTWKVGIATVCFCASVAFFLAWLDA